MLEQIVRASDWHIRWTPIHMDELLLCLKIWMNIHLHLTLSTLQFAFWATNNEERMMMSNHLQTPAIPTSFQPFYLPQVNKNLLNVLKMEAQPIKENPKQLIKYSQCSQTFIATNAKLYQVHEIPFLHQEWKWRSANHIRCISNNVDAG
jgi:hypothetical protein